MKKNDLISRSELIKAIRKHAVKTNSLYADEKTVVQIINDQPTIEAVPVERNKAIDEFANRVIERLEEMNCEAFKRDVMDIAEQMKGGI